MPRWMRPLRMCVPKIFCGCFTFKRDRGILRKMRFSSWNLQSTFLFPPTPWEMSEFRRTTLSTFRRTKEKLLMVKHIWTWGSIFQTQHFINNINNISPVLHGQALQIHLSCWWQFHLNSQRINGSQCKIIPRAQLFQWWFKVPMCLFLGFLMFTARLKHSRCSVEWISVPRCPCTHVGTHELVWVNMS